MTVQEVLREVQKDREKMVSDRHFLHTHPETGFELKETKAYVIKRLEEMGYQPVCCGRAGVIAVAGGKKAGKVFLLRGDMDALPVREEADIDFPSENGNMHACGHDMHTAMLLEAARILKGQEEELEGTVKIMFQPAEEIFEGSKDMIEAGLLKNPDVDAGMMLHVMAGMPFPNGTAIVCNGGVSAPAADYFTIRIQGKGCHGSMPNHGVDPINVAAHVVIALQEIHARELSLMDEAVLTIGTIHAGNVGNVIPDTAELSGTIRTYSEEVRSQIKNRMTEIVSHIAGAFRAEATVEFGSGCPTLKNDAALSSCVTKYITELHGQTMVFTAKQLEEMAGGTASKSSGSEDFAYVSHEIPTIMLALAAGNPKDGYRYPQHHPKVKFDDEALPFGASIYAYVAMRWLQEHKE